MFGLKFKSGILSQIIWKKHHFRTNRGTYFSVYCLKQIRNKKQDEEVIAQKLCYNSSPKCNLQKYLTLRHIYIIF